MTKEGKDITIDMATQLMLEKKAIEKDLERNPIDLDMIKVLTLGILLGIDKNPDEKDKLMEDLVKVFAPEQKKSRWIDNKCSECGKGIEDLISSNEWYENEKPKYCPFCGKEFKEIKT